MIETKPILGGGPLGGRSYKQSQFRAPAEPGPNYAKQTQLPEAGHRRGVRLAGRDAVGATWGKRAKQTQFPRRGWGAWGAGCCTNKANFRRTKEKGKCLAGKELW